MPEQLNMPLQLSTDRLNLVKRTHKYDVPLTKLIEDNRLFLQKYLVWPKFEKSFADIEKSTAQMMSLWENKTQFSYLITDKKDVILGAIDIAHIRNSEGVVEVGYWLRKDKTGNGFATEALTKVEEHIFSTHIQKIELECEDTNLPSINIALRCGYIETGHKEYSISEKATIYLKSSQTI